MNICHSIVVLVVLRWMTFDLSSLIDPRNVPKSASVARWVGLKVYKIMLKSSGFEKKVHVHKSLLDLCKFFPRYVFF